MAFLRRIIETISGLKNPDYLNGLAASMGDWLYVLLFVVIFAETGLVVAPFLPGDSLLFAVGAVSAIPKSQINLPMTAGLLIVAAVLGDAVNYALGYWFGPWAFASEKSRLFNKKHLIKAQQFYDRHGGKTIILARFVPIVRTFAPFVAGAGRMNYGRFLLFNVTGGVSWVLICLGAGWFFGNLPWVRKNFESVLVAIIVISVLPVGVELLKGWLAAREGKSTAVGAMSLEPTGLDEAASPSTLVPDGLEGPPLESPASGGLRKD